MLFSPIAIRIKIPTIRVTWVATEVVPQTDFHGRDPATRRKCAFEMCVCCFLIDFSCRLISTGKEAIGYQTKSAFVRPPLREWKGSLLGTARLHNCVSVE